LTLWPLVAWGRTNYNQADIPGGLSNVVSVVGGLYHSLALRADGTVVAWGAGTNNTGVTPYQGQAIVPGDLTNARQVAGGYYHSLALRSDGTVAAWGAGTTDTGASPHCGQAIVPGGLSNVVAIGGGGYHSLALKSDGTVAAWGAGTTNTGASPHYGQALVPGSLSNVVAVAAGGYHSLALKPDGMVVAWGAGATNTGSSPDYGQALAPSGLSNVVMIAAGGYHSLALKSDGTVVGWGDNTYGQTDAPASLSNVVAIAAGRYFSLALKSDGSIVAWGDNTYGQADAPVGLANVAGIAGGGFHALARESDGRPYLTVQPLSQTVPPGTAVRLLAMAVGLQPLSWQWQRNGTNLPGATSNSLTLAGVQCSDAGAYTLLVSNSLGSTPSSVAVLGISEATMPSITCPTNIVVSADAGQCSRSNVTWDVAASDNCAVTNLVSEPPSGSTFPVGVTTVRCTATDAGGNTNGCSFTVTVIAPPVILSGPTDQSVPVGQGTIFCVSATNACGGQLTYQWRFQGAEIPGATTDCYALTTARPANMGHYDVVVTNLAAAATSSVAVLTVVGPYLTVHPVELSPTGGEKTNFIFTFPSVIGIDYVVQYRDTLTDTNNWLPLITNPGTGSLITNDFPITTHPLSRFYRILVP
jgi:hypothetical protein